MHLFSGFRGLAGLAVILGVALVGGSRGGATHPLLTVTASPTGTTILTISSTATPTGTATAPPPTGTTILTVSSTATPTGTATAPPPTGTTMPPTATPFGTTVTPTSTSTAVTATATAPAGCGPAWSPIPYPPGGQVQGITADSATDAWTGGIGRVLHWDGSAWTGRSLPMQIPFVRFSRDSAAAPDDVWGLNSGQAVYWNGATWSALALPTATPGPFYSGSYQFHAIAAAAPNDVWVVGAYATNLSEINPWVVAHWNGSQWRVTEGPNTPTGAARPGGATAHAADLRDVTVAGPNEMWAVGYDSWLSPSPSLSHPVVLHMTGARSVDIGPLVTPTPDPYEEYNGVSAHGSGDIWIVGKGTDGPTSYHSTGGALTPVPVPPAAGPLTSVINAGGGAVWATGTTFLQWNGSQWVPVSSSATGALAAGGPYDVWAANASAILHWPDLPSFSDVSGANPFYRYAQVLACRNDISGYTCGGVGEPCDPQRRPYFRTGITVTRGQAAKIVATAAGLPGAPTGQTFADVPPSQPFYRWVERMASRNIVSGYACGGPGEPCDAQHRPYFRPYADVTRSQLAKIVALADGLSGPPAGQTFADVPPGHPFYLWVEQIAVLNVISGYTCGGPSEPCDAQHRPYFRPYRTATRGQSAKIIATTFFPGGGPAHPR